MLVSSDANAAQSHVPGEATRFFDDIGCMASAAGSNRSARQYVRLRDGGWSPAGTAWFAFSHGTRTPMDYGILAFDNRADAEGADRDGLARRWPDVIAYAEAR
jgi:hypothetical protein